jgi:hypothetical protein
MQRRLIDRGLAAITGLWIRDLPTVELPTRCEAATLSSWLERFIDLSSSIPNP